MCLALKNPPRSEVAKTQIQCLTPHFHGHLDILDVS